MNIQDLIASPRAQAVLDLMRPTMADVSFEIRYPADGRKDSALFVVGTERGKAMEFGVVVAEGLKEDMLLGAFENVARQVAAARQKS